MKRQTRSDAGFTLIELLVVLVIMPMIIGAIAVAIIASESGSSVAQTRLTDAEHAQITSEYFLRDVQGAQYVTTGDLDPPYTARSPSQCFDPNLLGPINFPVLALYRAATPRSGALSVAYWIAPVSLTDPIPQLALVRDACTVNTSNFSATLVSRAVISDDITPSQVAATISPASFAAAALTQWTPTSSAASTTLNVALDVTLGAGPFVVGVASTIGFQYGPTHPLSIVTTAGVQVVTCTGSLFSVLFTGCTGSPANLVLNLAIGVVVVQKTSISGIDLSVTEPGSGYTYSLQASPQQWSSG